MPNALASQPLQDTRIGSVEGVPSRSMHGLSIRALRSPVRGPFTIDLASGECTVVSGPSGSGKSLFLRMIADLDPNEGSVRLEDLDRDDVEASHWRRLVTYVAADSGWWVDRVGDHMSDPEAARAHCPDVGLDPALMDAPVARLSTGERQRAALIRAIIGKPRFLLLDEPTSALDPTATGLVEFLLQRLTEEGIGIVVVSHDVLQGKRIADRRLVMSIDGIAEAVG